MGEVWELKQKPNRQNSRKSKTTSMYLTKANSSTYTYKITLVESTKQAINSKRKRRKNDQN